LEMASQPINNLTRIDRSCPTLVRRQRNWSVVAILGAAAVAGFAAGAAAVTAGFAAGAAALDTSSILNGAIHLSFPEANRATKRDRLRVPIPDNERGVAIKRDAKDKDSGSLRSPVPRETETKPIVHCELVASPLAGPAVRKTPLRSCLAWLETLPQYTYLGLFASHIS
jgi:hypothetical protein